VFAQGPISASFFSSEEVGPLELRPNSSQLNSTNYNLFNQREEFMRRQSELKDGRQLSKPYVLECFTRYQTIGGSSELENEGPGSSKLIEIIQEASAYLE
jgi:hypothetical protein